MKYYKAVHLTKINNFTTGSFAMMFAVLYQMKSNLLYIARKAIISFMLEELPLI